MVSGVPPLPIWTACAPQRRRSGSTPSVLARRPSTKMRCPDARAGISTVILPKENEADLDDLPREVRKQMTFVLADHVDEVIEAAFPGADVVEFSSAARG